MRHLKVQNIREALHPSEAVVEVSTQDGPQFVVVSRNALDDDKLSVSFPLMEEQGHYLVQLPAETQSGAWRVWVPKSEVA